MPNHIKNRVIIHGTPEQVKDVFDKFNTHHPASLRKSCDGELICVDKESKQFQGWFNPKDCIFMFASDRKKISGLPVNMDFEINPAWDQFPDFDKVAPMPDVLKDLNPHGEIVNAVKKKYNHPINGHPLLAALELQARVNQAIEFEGEKKELFDRCCEAYEKTGYAYWYDWCIAYWGTKWNSYECERETCNTYTFETAWSNVLNIIKKISEQCVGIGIGYEYADENTGYNCGEYTLMNGEIIFENIPEGGSCEAYDLAFRLRPERKEWYELKDGAYTPKQED